MKRSELLAKLQAVEPAIAALELIPAMTQIWFTGEQVLAFNDQIAISSSLETDFIGGVRGKLLISLLQNSGAKETTFTSDKDFLHLKAGGAAMKLKTFVGSKALHEMPKLNRNKVVPIKLPELVKAFEVCMLSAGGQTLVPGQYHFTVTMEPKEGEIGFFATDDVTFSFARSKIDGSPGFKGQAVVTASFAQQAVKLAKGIEKGRLEVSMADGYCLLDLGDTTLFGRMTNVEKPEDWGAAINRLSPKGLSLVDTPETLANAIERACAVSGERMDFSKTQMAVKSGKLTMATRGEYADINDVLTIDSSHPEAEAKVSARLLRNGCANFSKIAVTDSCIVFSKNNARFCVESLRA